MEFPKISAYCATYGRPKVLEEAVESFLKQDYKGQKELIILNDFKSHNIKFDHPEVKIFNLDEKIFPLGKKFNETIKLCSGDIIFAWEDDDIYLPNRISLTVRRMIDNNNKIFHTRQAYVELNSRKILNSIEHWKTSLLFHSNLAMYKEVFEDTGGYIESDKINLDFESIKKFFNSQNYSSEKVDLKEIFYIYRLKTNSYHATILSYNKKEISHAAEDYVNENNTIFGDYYLNPNWRYDYVDEVNKLYLNKKINLFKLVKKNSTTL